MPNVRWRSHSTTAVAAAVFAGSDSNLCTFCAHEEWEREGNDVMPWGRKPLYYNANRHFRRSTKPPWALPGLQAGLHYFPYPIRGFPRRDPQLYTFCAQEPFCAPKGTVRVPGSKPTVRTGPSRRRPACDHPRRSRAAHGRLVRGRCRVGGGATVGVQVRSESPSPRTSSTAARVLRRPGAGCRVRVAHRPGGGRAAPPPGS